MFGEGNYGYGWFEQTKPNLDLGIAPWPQRRSRQIFIGGYGLFLGNTGDADRQEVAWKFVKWLAQPQAQLQYVDVTKQIPSSRTAITSPSFQAEMNRFPAMAAYVHEVVGHGVAQFIPIGYGDILQKSLSWAGRALNGQISPEAAVKGLKDEIKGFYADIKDPLL